MNLILHTVKQEKQRIEYMLAKYQSELSILPKGAISEKKVGEKTYYYLKYRRHMEAMVKSLQAEKAIADKVLESTI